MNPQILAILTVFIIGLVSFLIGYFATKANYDKKIEDLNRKNNALEQSKHDFVKEITKLKKAGESSQSLLKNAADENSQLQEINERIKMERSNLEKKFRALTEKSKPEKVDRLLDALGKEKQERVLLLAELNELKALHMGKDVIKEAPVKTEKNNLKYRLTNVFQRIGLRNTTQADRLIAIKGLTAGLSSKLNKIGVFNYKQIGLLEESDIDTVAEAIGISSEVIINDDWIGQARQLYKAQYSS